MYKIYLMLWIVGIYLILSGALLITRRKFVIRQFCYTILIVPFYIIYIILIASWVPNKFTLVYIIIILPLIAFSYVITKGRYELNNVNKEMTTKALTSILENAKISHEIKGNTVILNDYDDRHITFKQMLCTVGIDFSDIIDLPFYRTIKKEFTTTIKQIETTVFPSKGVFCLTMGAAVFIFTMIDLY